MKNAQEALDNWLAKCNARCVDIVQINKNRAFERWMIGGKIIIVIRYSDDRGWDVFVPASDSIRIDETLEAVEKALGLK